MGANDRVRVALIGAGDRAKGALVPAFQDHAKELNFEFVAVSDIWNRRRDEGAAFIQKQCGSPIASVRNNDELYARKDVDAVIVATADFQHASHGVEAVQAGRDAYVEKPTAHTMEDARAFRAAVKQTGKVVAVGTQRRSTPSYQKAYEYIQSGKFGDIVAVEMTWNVNQPGRWRRPGRRASVEGAGYGLEALPAQPALRALRCPQVSRVPPLLALFLGIPDQWLVHQIDTVHWFTGYPHPRSVVANGGIYLWKDGRKNWDTMTAVFDYGPLDDPSKGFQVIYSSRMTNSAGGVKEIYYSNGGMLDMDKQCVNSEGGMTAKAAAEMGMKQNLLGDYSLSDTVMKAETSANTGNDPMTSANMRNWMECVRSRKTAQREHRGRVQPFGGAVHEHCCHPDRSARHLRRQVAARDGRGQGL